VFSKKFCQVILVVLNSGEKIELRMWVELQHEAGTNPYLFLQDFFIKSLHIQTKITSVVRYFNQRSSFMKKQTTTVIVTTIITVVALVAVFVFLMPIIGPRYLHSFMMGNQTAPGGLDTSTSMLSENGLFRVSWSSDPASPPLNQIHTWTIHVETADGQVVDNAEITVDGGMPQHGHGLPTNPQVTQNLGNGDYLVEGMKFQMLGWWEVRFHINAGGQNDTVTFNLTLE
jgi:hypothetical protein